jgi:hypothetical protein
MVTIPNPIQSRPRLHKLSSAVLPSLEALLEDLFWNGEQLCRRVLYDVLAASGVFNLANREKSREVMSGE